MEPPLSTKENDPQFSSIAPTDDQGGIAFSQIQPAKNQNGTSQDNEKPQSMENMSPVFSSASTMNHPNSVNSQQGPAPYLNQLLTNNQHPSKYMQPNFSQNMPQMDYNKVNWSGAPMNYPHPQGQMRPGGPGMAPPRHVSNVQMPTGTMELSGGQPYGHPQYSHAFRRPAPNSSAYNQPSNMEISGSDDQSSSATQHQRVTRPPMGPGANVMGPPRPPMDGPGGMMPPPGQGPYPGMPYAYRSGAPMHPYNAFAQQGVPPNRTAPPQFSSPNPGMLPQSPSSLNGPHTPQPKNTMPASPSQKPPRSPSQIRGMSPVNANLNLPHSPAHKSVNSPVHSPKVQSHRGSMPPSPANQQHSPHVPSPRSQEGGTTSNQGQITTNSNVAERNKEQTHQLTLGPNTNPQINSNDSQPSGFPPNQSPMMTQPHTNGPTNPGAPPAHQINQPGFPNQNMMQGGPNPNMPMSSNMYPPQQPWSAPEGELKGSGTNGPAFRPHGKPTPPPGIDHVKMNAASPRSVPSPSVTNAASPRPQSRKNSSNDTKTKGTPAAHTLHGSIRDIVDKQISMGPETIRAEFMNHICMFYHENNTPLTANPQMGKNPLDLFKCFTAVKDKGGFLQVCKRKQWKQIGQALMEGPPTNIAFTLKKAYIKHLLPYECKFDRNGVDPKSVLAQIETKKEKTRAAPSPAGSSNSQDSRYPDYPAGMPPHPGMPHPGMPNHMPGHPHQQMAHPAVPYPHDPNMPPQQQQYMSQFGPGQIGMPNGHGPQPRPQMNQQYPGMSGENNNDQNNMEQYRNQQMQGSMPPFNNQVPPQGAMGGYPQRPYGPRMAPGQDRSNYPIRAPFPPQSNMSPVPQNGPNAPTSRPRMPVPTNSGYPPAYPNKDSTNSSVPTGSNYPTSFPNSISSHHDSRMSTMTSGGMTPDKRIRAPYYPQHVPSTPRGALSAMLSQADSNKMGPNSQWRQRIPGPPNAQFPSSSESRSQYPPNKHIPHKKDVIIKDMVFPSGTIEATQPVEKRRKTLTAKDIGKVDQSRLVMCMKSGLLCETVWALDSLNALLRDDHSISYFVMEKMPRLFECLLIQYRKCLACLFDELSNLATQDPFTGDQSTVDEHPVELSVDDQIVEHDHKQLYINNANYSWITRSGRKVKVAEQEIYDTVLEKINKQEIVETHPIATFLLDIHPEDYRKRSQCHNFSSNIKEEPIDQSDRKKSESSADNENEHGCNRMCVKLNCCIKSEPGTQVKEEIEEKMDTEEELMTLKRKRRFSRSIDNEPCIRWSSLVQYDGSDTQEQIMNRCLILSNIFRSLTFNSHNEKFFAKNNEMLEIFSRIINLRLTPDYDKTTDRAWWWNGLDQIREDTFVCISNFAGYIKTIHLPNQICYPLLDSLLNWITSDSAYSQDPCIKANSSSIQSLVMEIFSKMCAQQDNIHMILATPSSDRLEKFINVLMQYLSATDQVKREFALVVISCIATADQDAARLLATQPSCVSQLIGLIEACEMAAMEIAQRRGLPALRENPDAMGTTLEMIRRTSAALVAMAQIPENHEVLMKQQDRLLVLVMSQILDQHVAKMLADVLYQASSTNQQTINKLLDQSEASKCSESRPDNEKVKLTEIIDKDISLKSEEIVEA